MCIFNTVVCIECGATELVQNLCHILYPLVAPHEALHAVEARDCVVEGICNNCTSLLAIIEFNFEDKPQHPEPPFEEFEPETERSSLNDEISEGQTEEVELPFGPFDEESFEEGQEEVDLADLSSMDLSG